MYLCIHLDIFFTGWLDQMVKRDGQTRRLDENGKRNHMSDLRAMVRAAHLTKRLDESI